jgi:chromate reductase
VSSRFCGPEQGRSQHNGDDETDRHLYFGPNSIVTVQTSWGGETGVTERRIEVAALVGSLRRQSFNRGLLRAAMLVRPDNMHLYEVPIRELPYFNEDLEQGGNPSSVREFRSQLERADALLICTPEYSYSIPGVLKNALDWASRPAGRSVLRGTPLAILGASSGRSGTMRGQLHLRQISVAIGMLPLPEPETYITFAGDKFNQQGELTDQTSRDLVKTTMANLAEWTELLS